MADAVDDSLRARLHARLAADMIAANELDAMPRAMALADDAARAARRAGDFGALAHALMACLYAAALGMLDTVRGPGGDALVVPSPQDILEAAEEGGELEIVMQIRHTRAVFMLAIGEAEAYWAEIDALATLAASSRVPEALWLADALGAMRATVEGRFADGHRLMEQALAIGIRMQVTNAVGVHVSQQVMWHAMQGRLADILPVLTEFVDARRVGVAWPPVRALARLESGDEIGARAQFGRRSAPAELVAPSRGRREGSVR
jgi:hypothetical protein